MQKDTEVLLRSRIYLEIYSVINILKNSHRLYYKTVDTKL
jgi:hypothetical protein